MSQDGEGKKQSWLPLESNPDLFNLFLTKLGADLDGAGIQFTDVYGLDESLLEMVPKPVAAVFLVYPCNDAGEEYNAKCNERTLEMIKAAPEGQTAPGQASYFITQKIGNACGTIALCHAALNAGLPLKAGSFLSGLHALGRTATPGERAAYLESGASGDALEKAHEAAAVEGQTDAASAKDTNLHFVCFVRTPDGWLCEFDGRKATAVPHVACPDPSKFLELTAKIIQTNFFEGIGGNFAEFAITALAGKQE